MSSFDWHHTRETDRCNGYRIRRVDAERASWVLEFDGTDAIPLGLRSRDAGRRYRSLRCARAAAVHMEVVRLRRLKLTRHWFLSAVLLTTSVGFYLTMEAADQSSRIEWFLAALAVFVVGFSEGLDGVVILISDGWDHAYDVPRITRIDTWIGRTMARLRTPTSRCDGIEDEPRVRVVAVDRTTPFLRN